MIQKFREIMIEDTYRMCTFRVRPEFLRPIQVLSSKIKRRAGTILPHSEWDTLLARTWGLRSSELGEMDPIIAVASDKDITRLTLAARFIQVALRSQHPRGLTLQQLADGMKTRPMLRGLGEDKIRVLVRCTKNIEKVADRYRIRDRHMAHRTDQYHIILLRAGRPLHYRELARRAVTLGYTGNNKQGQSVTNLLVRDPRFIAVAHSGRWALAEWPNVETRTITQIAFDEIQLAARPLHQDELYSAIVKRRAAKRRSIRQMLAQSSQFKKVGQKTWTICE